MNFTNQLVLADTIFLPKTKIGTITKNIVLVISFAVLTALCAQIKLEVGIVPITMQTFMVLLSGALLGSKRGALSQLSYLLMGLAGVPWFSRGGGLGYILSPTFGYIIGFVFAAFIVGFLCEKGLGKQVRTAVLAMFAGNITIYVFGLSWLAKFACPEANLFCFGVGFGEILAIGFYPFILGDIIKILLAGLALPLGWKAIKKLKIN